MATPDRILLDKAINLINNVGQYGPLDATIDSYKQAADYADDAKKYAELAQSGITSGSISVSTITASSFMFTETLGDFYGEGSPEGVVVATRGSTYRQIDGEPNACFYVKESDEGSVGWVAK